MGFLVQQKDPFKGGNMKEKTEKSYKKRLKRKKKERERGCSRSPLCSSLLWLGLFLYTSASWACDVRAVRQLDYMEQIQTYGS